MKKILSFLWVITILGASTFVATAYSNNQKHEVIQISLQDSTSQALQEYEEEVYQKKFRLIHNGKEYSTTIKELGLDIQADQQKSYLNDISNLISPFTKQRNLGINLSIVDSSYLNQNILKVLGLNSEPIEPSILYKDNSIQTIQGENGYVVLNLDEIEEALLTQEPTITIQTQTISPSTSEQEILEQKELLEQFSEQTITLKDPNSLFTKDLIVSKEDVQVDSSALYYLNEETFNNLHQELKENIEQKREDLIINSIDTDTNQAELEGDLKDGYSLSKESLKQTLITTLNTELKTAELKVDVDKAEVINNFNDQTYTLLGRGISNYTGSGAGRAHNIQFASDTKYKSLFIPQGSKFQFNSHLGGPVTISRGWQNAYVISGGKIVPAPGGGICQMSTTVYRAALNAGLQIDWASNHSLYVHYYTAYGDGLDAAIFPGSKDLHFTNDTPSDVILHSYYNDKQDLIVNILGADDGREVALHGPFTSGDNGSNPFDVTTRTNQINWVRQITTKEGETKNETLTSTYTNFYRK